MRWAWKFTVRARAAGACQNCGRSGIPLDTAHIQERTARPDLEFDPANGMCLCRSCHLRYDHANNHRAGRPFGFRLSAASKAAIGEKSSAYHGTPEGRERLRAQTAAAWDRRGRKYPERACAHCGATFKPRDARGRFCSSACHYAFRTGKARTGY